MTIPTIQDFILANYQGVILKNAYSERSFFYNPGRRLPNGVYFATIKEQDGPNDRAGHLDRPGVFRLSIGTDKATYERLFGPKPARPARGQTVDLAYDFGALNELLPHPVYAWMHFVCINNPEEDKWEEVTALLDQAYELVREKFRKKTAAARKK